MVTVYQQIAFSSLKNRRREKCNSLDISMDEFRSRITDVTYTTIKNLGNL